MNSDSHPSSDSGVLNPAREDLGFGVPPDHFSDKIHQLYNYWTSKRGERPAPDRSDLDPLIEIPRLLSNVWLLNVEQNPRRYRYRLVGSALIDAGTTARIGQYLDQVVLAAELDDVLAALDRACDDSLPFWRCGSPRMQHDRFVTYLESLSLPLTTGGKDINMVMNMSVYTWVNV